MGSPRTSPRAVPGRRRAPGRDPAGLPAPVGAHDLIDRLEALRDRIAPRVPGIDPGDLLLILQCVISPLGSGRRFFLREVRPGVNVP